MLKFEVYHNDCHIGTLYTANGRHKYTPKDIPKDYPAWDLLDKAKLTTAADWTLPIPVLANKLFYGDKVPEEAASEEIAMYAKSLKLVRCGRVEKEDE